MIYLKKLNFEDAKIQYEFLKQLPPENGFMNDYYHVTFEDFFNVHIQNNIDQSFGIGLETNRVPSTWFFLYDDNIIVGLFKVRHCLNEILINGSGHIGYGIHPCHRKKGYATIGVKLAIEKLKEMPDFLDEEVYFSHYIDNVASLKAVLKNDGYIHHQDEQKYYTRIKIR